jgi:hypothetical protein
MFMMSPSGFSVLGLLAEDLDDDRFVGLVEIALARAGHPGPALTAEAL